MNHGFERTFKASLALVHRRRCAVLEICWSLYCRRRRACLFTAVHVRHNRL